MTDDIRHVFALVAALVLAGLGTWLLYHRSGRVAPQNGSMPFLHHVEELRRRLVRLAIIMSAWMTFLLTFKVEPLMVGGIKLGYPVPSVFNAAASQVYLWIGQETVPRGVQLIVSTPTEAVGAQLGIAFLLSVIIVVPFLFYEVWAFFSPGLSVRERRFLRTVLPVAFGFFLVGCAFGFFAVVPILFEILYSFATPLGATAFLSASSLVGTVVSMSAVFGLCFELPVGMVALTRLGLLSPRTYIRRWRHATLAIVVVAGLVTDPTLASQLVVAVIFLCLYWGGVMASFLVQQRDNVTHREFKRRPNPAPSTKVL